MTHFLVSSAFLAQVAGLQQLGNGLSGFIEFIFLIACVALIGGGIFQGWRQHDMGSACINFVFAGLCAFALAYCVWIWGIAGYHFTITPTSIT